MDGCHTFGDLRFALMEGLLREADGDTVTISENIDLGAVEKLEVVQK